MCHVEIMLLRAFILFLYVITCIVHHKPMKEKKTRRKLWKMSGSFSGSAKLVLAGQPHLLSRSSHLQTARYSFALPNRTERLRIRFSEELVSLRHLCSKGDLPAYNRVFQLRFINLYPADIP